MKLLRLLIVVRCIQKTKTTFKSSLNKHGQLDIQVRNGGGGSNGRVTPVQSNFRKMSTFVAVQDGFPPLFTLCAPPLRKLSVTD